MAATCLALALLEPACSLLRAALVADALLAIVWEVSSFMSLTIFLLSQACRRACDGVNLAEGSQSKHLFRKSRNSGSSQPLRAAVKFLDPGIPRILPLLDRPAITKTNNE